MSVWSTMKRAIRRPLEDIYEARLAAHVHQLPPPRHVGVILDGNRRWAAEQGGPASRGHRVGASRIANLLEWCNEQGVEVVTLWLLSTDNLTRSESELIPLLGIIQRTADELVECGKYRVRVVGALSALPAQTAGALQSAEAVTRDVEGMMVNMAVAYGGRREVVDAVKAFLSDEEQQGRSLHDVIDDIDVSSIEAHLYTKGQPDPDLVIRTSGEQRLSGFLLWQSAHSEYYFCDAYWPDFRRIDFLRALRDFGMRKRRFGG